MAWSKGGAEPVDALPWQETAAGALYTDLANNPEGRAACGWLEASDKPEAWPGKLVVWRKGQWRQVDAPAPPPPAPRILSRIDFQRRFTVEELAAIQGADDPLVKNFLFSLTIVLNVDLDNADTQAGVGYLEQHELIAAGRAAEILA